MFTFSGKDDRQEKAWKSCWKLCQKLYDTRDERITTQVRPTLDLCRDFCQSLFEVRQRENEKADSVLRVSFELNNHLYNTHDRNLPEAFRERTLDFYITLCHRLMKQRSDLARETDSLLAACWSLAEMLFSLRQNRREGKPADEELLGSAVQACWELCDLFREGWTQIRPDRGTPRPSQTTFTQAFHQAKQNQSPPASWANVSPEYEESSYGAFGRANPETPTTIFEDTNQTSPDEGLPPNILVLGPDQKYRNQQHTPSRQRKYHPSHRSTGSGSLPSHPRNARSATSSSSNSTIINSSPPQPSSTPYADNDATLPPEEDPHLTCLKLLVIKAAMSTGYQRPRSPTTTRSPPLQPQPSTGQSSSSPPSLYPSSGNPPKTPLTLGVFVKSLPSNSFGTQPWQTSLLENYKKLVLSDPMFSSASPFAQAPGTGPGEPPLSNSVSGVPTSSASTNTAGVPVDPVMFGPPRRARASDVARSVRWMVNGHGGRYAWLNELYRWVFGFRLEEGEARADVVIQS